MAKRKHAKHESGSAIPQASGDRPLPPAHSPEILRDARKAVMYAVGGKKKRASFGDAFEAQDGKVYIRGCKGEVAKILDRDDSQFWNSDAMVILRGIHSSYLGDNDRMLMIGALTMALTDQEKVDKAVVKSW